MDTAALLRDYIVRELFDGEAGTPLAEDDNLFTRGLDSMGVLQLTAFLEETFEIKIQPKEFVPENFRSIAVISELIRRKTGAKR